MRSFIVTFLQRLLPRMRYRNISWLRIQYQRGKVSHNLVLFTELTYTKTTTYVLPNQCNTSRSTWSRCTVPIDQVAAYSGVKGLCQSYRACYTHLFTCPTLIFLTCPVGQPRQVFHLPDREFHLPRAVGLVGLSTPDLLLARTMQ